MKLKDLVLSSLLAITAMPIGAHADWIHYQGNAGHTGFVNAHTNPAYYRTLWHRKLGDEKYNAFYTRFIIIKNMAFYTIQEFTSNSPGINNYEVDHRLMAVNTDTGETVWSVHLPKDIEYRDLQYIKGKLLLIWKYGSGRHVFAYEPKTGKQLYSSRIPNNLTFTEVGNNNLYFMEDTKGTSIIGTLNPENGWPNLMVSDGNYEQFNGFAVAKNNLFTMSYDYNNHDNIIALRDLKSGAVTSTINIDANEFGELSSNMPVIDDDVTHAAYFKLSSKNAYFLAYDLANTTKEKWKIRMHNWSSSTPVVAGNEIYISEADENYHATINAYDSNSGRLLWSWNAEKDKYSSYQPIATIDTLFVPTEKATYAISRTNHQVVWRLDVTGKLAIADNKLIITTDDDVTVVALNK